MPAKTTDLPDHPAKFAKSVLAAARPWISTESDRLGRSLSILDPFAGVGRVHSLRDEGHFTIGIELEPEWADQSPYTFVGDTLDIDKVLRLNNCGMVFDVLFTSPVYGNRMSDKHNNQDACKRCSGSGEAECTAEVDGTEVNIGEMACSECRGTGKSRRNTYTHVLGHQLSENNSGAMQWGQKYRRFHEEAWSKIYDHVRSLWMVNLSNHIRGGSEQHVLEWHLGYFIQDLGLRVLSVEPIETRRNRDGANGKIRVDNEFLLVLRKD